MQKYETCCSCLQQGVSGECLRGGGNGERCEASQSVLAKCGCGGQGEEGQGTLWGDKKFGRRERASEGRVVERRRPALLDEADASPKVTKEAAEWVAVT
jgi:hypothetical protein